MLLDDVFSGMDAHTVDVVSPRLFGHRGLLRKQQATVILTTHHRTEDFSSPENLSITTYMCFR